MSPIDPLKPVQALPLANVAGRATHRWRRLGKLRMTRPWLVRWEPLLLPWLMAFCVAHGLAAEGWSLPTPWLLACAGLLLGLAVRVVLRPNRIAGRILLPAALALLGLAAGLLHGHWRMAHHEVLPDGPPMVTTLRGVARPFQRDWTLETGHYRLLIRDKRPEAATPPVGSTVEVTGSLSAPRPALFEGGFDERRYLGGLGLDGTVFRVERLRVLNPTPRSWMDRGLIHLNRFRHTLQNGLTHALGPEHGALVGGLVLGEQAMPMSDLWRQQFRQTGLVHFLAASGMNVGLVAGATAGLLALCRLPGRLILLVVMAVVAFYCGLTGLPPSIQRAGMMIELALVLKFFNRRLSGLMLLLLALAALLLLQPLALWSLGLQLSVLTTLGILGWTPQLMRWLGPWLTRPLTATLTVPMVAQLWASPLIVYYFNQLPLHSVGLNLLAAPLISIMTILGFVGVLLAAVWAPAAELCWRLCAPLAKGLLWLVSTGASQDWAMWHPASPPIWAVVWFYMALLIPLLGWHPRFVWPGRVVYRVTMICLLIAAMPGLVNVWHLGRHPGPTLHQVPLSDHKVATLLQPSPQKAPWAVLPARLTDWEAQQLIRYCAHRGWTTLPKAVILGTATDSPGLITLHRELHLSQFAIAHPETRTPVHLTLALPRPFILQRTDRLLLPGGWAQYSVDGARRPSGKSLGLLVEWQGARLVWGRYDRVPILPAHGYLTWADLWAGRPWFLWNPTLQPSGLQPAMADAAVCRWEPAVHKANRTTTKSIR